ncbi:MAG: hypothetical protein IPO04_19410 [Cytophagaceae bacterium]|nr:hypothetical protein [Cytophagaceae bacterium]
MDIETNKIKSPFTVPEGYFSELEDRILSEVRVRTLTEDQPFQAPEGYFESFEERILGAIKTEEFPKEQPFKASEDYFSELENQILGRIALENISKRRLLGYLLMIILKKWKPKFWKKLLAKNKVHFWKFSVTKKYSVMQPVQL